QTLAVELALDFTGIGVGNRGDAVGKDQAALEHVGVALELHAIGGEDPIGQAGVQLEGGDVPDALEAQVVDGHDGADTVIERVILEERVQEYRNDTGL